MRKRRSDPPNVQPNTAVVCYLIVSVSKQKGHGLYVPFDEGSRQQLLGFVATSVKGWWFHKRPTFQEMCSLFHLERTFYVILVLVYNQPAIV